MSLKVFLFKYERHKTYIRLVSQCRIIKGTELLKLIKQCNMAFVLKLCGRTPLGHRCRINTGVSPLQYPTESFHCPKNPLCSVPSSLLMPGTTYLSIVSIVLSFPECHILCNFSRLAFYTQQYAFKDHPCFFMA